MMRLAMTALALLAPIAAHAASVSLAERQWWAKGSYGAFAQPFGAGTFKPGVDYANSIAIDTASFPAGTTIDWRWPLSIRYGVRSYNHLPFGNYDGSVMPMPVAPIQAKAIKTLLVTADISYASHVGEFNILEELYLTRERGNAASKVLEIGFMRHTPASTAAWAATGKALGTMTDKNKRVWRASVRDGGSAGRYLLFIPTRGNDFLIGTTDYKSAVAFAIAHGLATGDEWVNGVALGVEAIWGSGSLKVNRYSVTLR